MPTQFSNTAVETTLDGGISDSATTLDVADASGYPDVPFNIQINDEVVRVGAKSSLTFSSLTRGYDGTTTAAHTTGDAIAHVVVAGDMETAAHQTDTWLDALFRRPSGETIHADDDEFDDGSIDGAWTQLTVSGTTTWSESGGRLLAKTDSQTAADNNPILRSLGSLTYPLTIDTAVSYTSPWATYLMVGVAFSDGVVATSNAICGEAYVTTAADAGPIIAFRADGTWTNIVGSGTVEKAGYGMLYLRVVWTAANAFTFLWSADGVNYLVASTATPTVTPTHYGLFVGTWGVSAQRNAAFEYFRVTESDLS